MKTTTKFSRILLLSVLILTNNTIFVNASSVITGHVFDNKNQPLNFATVTILNPATKQIVEGDMCDSKGEFIIENVKPGDYILSVRMLGFEKNELLELNIDTVNTLTKVDKIFLKQSPHELPEVVVTAKLKTVEQTSKKTLATIKQRGNPVYILATTQFDFSSSYKKFLRLYDLKSLDVSLDLKPILYVGTFLGNYIR